MNDIVIKRIRIDGFKEENKFIDLKLSNMRTSILYGINGSGKTTLLNLIYSTFEKDEEALIRDNVTMITIEYEIKGTIYKVKIKRLNNGYDWNKFDSSALNNIKLLYITPGRAYSEYRRDITIEQFHDYLMNNPSLSLNINSGYEEIKKIVAYINGVGENIVNEWLNSNENICVSGIKVLNVEEIVRFNEKVNTRRKKLKKLTVENLILTKIIDFLKLTDSSSEILEEKIEFTNKQKNFLISIKSISGEIINYIESGYLTEKKKDIIVNIKKDIDNFFNEYEIMNKSISLFEKYTGKKIYIDENKVGILDNNHVYSFKMLSHGERHLLTLLVLVEYLGKERQLVIIDEPEIALDTRWQEKILSMFESITNSQMILACHSPYVAIDNFESQIKFKGGLK